MTTDAPTPSLIGCVQHDCAVCQKQAKMLARAHRANEACEAENAKLHDELAAARAEAQGMRADKERLDLIESKRATVYAQVDQEYGLMHWVFVDETNRERRGIVEKTLRAAIDAAKERKQPPEAEPGG